MKRSIQSSLSGLAFLLGITPASADWKEEIGFARLQAVAAADLPQATTQGLAQIEAPETSGNFEPDKTSSLFIGFTFVSKSGASGASGHANKVASNFYGAASMLPGASTVDLYNANSWLGTGFLRSGSTSVPLSENRAVQNHSWIGNLSTASQTEEACRRLDYSINNDDYVCVVGVNNGFSTTLPGLLCHSYNSISVGRDDGQHSAGLTTLDGAGRMKPDLVAPSASPEDATSWTTPMVAGSAGLLYAKLRATPYSQTGADLARIVKALLLAGATKNTVPNWDNSPTSPLDTVYGAGELNLHHSYLTLRSGEVTASNSVMRSSRAWAAETASSSNPKTYFFQIPAGATTPFSAALIWNRDVATASRPTRTWTPSLQNLRLRLYEANGFTLGNQISSSDSAIDNVELIYQASLAPGSYALVVESAASTSNAFALAWHSLPAVSVTATLATASEMNAQAGLITFTRTSDATLPLLVPIETSGTAASGIHFQPLPSSITIPAGQSSATLQVLPISDAIAQGDRSLVVSLATDFSYVSGSNNQATITILDKPFDHWRFSNFTNSELENSAISGETADPDGDQIPNLLEYGLGFSPKAANVSPATLSHESGYMEISVTKNPNATDLTWDAEVSANLVNWEAAVVTGNSGTNFVARDVLMIEEADKRFIRLKVSR
jgi:hypothetical protein